MATTTLGNKAIGDIVKLKVNGTAKEFIVVHKGKPSSIYDNSFNNGVILLMKDVYENRQWSANKLNILESSDINTYLNGTFLGLFDKDIQAQIKQVKIPYRKDGGQYGTDQTGANGLSCKIFLLSCYEVGWTTSTNQSFPIDGAILDYFNGTAATDAKRIAKFNGKDTLWWLRSPDTSHSYYVYCVFTNGYYARDYANETHGIRPALVLPSTLWVSDDGSVQTTTAPTTPASITIPSSIQGGTSIQISWAASTDAENNLEGYVVERSVDGGGAWTQVYQGSATSTTNTVPAGTETVMSRVKAYDSEGLYSSYRNSSQVTVFNNTAPGAPGSITIPAEVLGGGTLKVSWGAASDPDNNLTGYELERQVDGTGEWTQVY